MNKRRPTDVRILELDGKVRKHEATIEETLELFEEAEKLPDAWCLIVVSSMLNHYVCSDKRVEFRDAVGSSPTFNRLKGRLGGLIGVRGD